MAQTKEHTVEILSSGEDITISVGGVEREVSFSDVNPQYAMREFLRGLKLRIDNAAAGIDDPEKKAAAKAAMLEKIDFSDPSGGISGGRRKESAESFLARVKMESLEDYQKAVGECQAVVRKDEQSDALVELSARLAEIL